MSNVLPERSASRDISGFAIVAQLATLVANCVTSNRIHISIFGARNPTGVEDEERCLFSR